MTRITLLRFLTTLDSIMVYFENTHDALNVERTRAIIITLERLLVEINNELE